ncbi:hypothetical protein KUTeg_011770 [Tegillarca granosa]|uniref:DNA repair protein complementing XP-G cells n=1 Tax=Tegillarca granosa TaxID=220873 RepID=A0ABQ9EXL7_TEGGR|nr:hypothetical protein KUTeg_011770 [Tegillarca granosa]
MGVHGLWQLLQSTGKTVPLDSLEGKVLAVDVSIWLHQAIKGMRDRDGNTLPNAHLQVLFNRICKLLYYRIKPVFVFDGGVPELKKQTLVSRRERKEFANQESERTSKKLLENLMRSRAVKEVLAGEAVKDDKPIKVNKNRTKDLYELPPLPKEFQSLAEENDYWEERKQTQQMIQEELETNADFDTTSEDFQSLPPELKHEILTEIQERTKRTPWTNIHELPEESGDFSNYQMKKLLKKGRLTHQLDHVRKEMLTRTAGAITPGLNDDFYSDDIQTRRVVSSDTSHYVLIKGIGHKQQQKLARKHLEENMELEKKSENEKAKDIENNEKLSESVEKEDIDRKSESIDIFKENKDNEVLSEEKQSSERVATTNKVCEVIPINDDVNETCEQKSAISDDVINLSDSEEPKPSTSSGSTNIQPGFSGGHDIDVDSDSDDDNGGISQQEILAMIKNENAKSLKSAAMTENRFSISDDSSDDSDVETQLESKITKVSPKVISKGIGDFDMKKKSDEKTGNKDLHDMETLITERKRRLSLEQEVCIEKKKHKKVDDDDTIKTIETAVGKESAKGDNSEIAISDEESEDEGFIEVSIDPNKATQDNLFPEDIFEAPDKMAASALPDVSDQDQIQVAEPAKNLTADELTKQSTSDSAELRKKSASLDVEDEEEDESSHLGHRDLAKDFEGLNEFDLQEWQDELEAESKTLKEEMNKQERLGASITDEMYVDAQALLKIFGLPFITSPMEAEAQCAKLDELDLTQGTITDDSDVWLFGGKRVYKNFYQKDKHVEFYNNASIQSQLGLNRTLLINIALLCGSDYTEGIQGVGPIKAMEIMTEFPGDGIRGLEYFRDWWEECQRQPKMPHEAKIRTQLRKLEVRPGICFDMFVTSVLSFVKKYLFFSQKEIAKIC